MKKLFAMLFCVLLSVCATAESKMHKKSKLLDWYIVDTVVSKAEISSPILVKIALGYMKKDKQTLSEIKERRIEISDFIARYFSDLTLEEMNNKNVLEEQICAKINDEILCNGKILDIKILSE